jgi:hypothetical protein
MLSVATGSPHWRALPKTVLADRMGCLKSGVVANILVPTAD